MYFYGCVHKVAQNRGLRDRKNPLSSLPLQAYQVKKQPRTPDKGTKKPRLHRPPRSDSEIATSNAFQLLYMDTGDGSSSESEYHNPIS